MENSIIIQKSLQIVKENLEIYIESNLKEIYGQKYILYLNINATNDLNEKNENMIDYVNIEQNYRKKYKDVAFFTNLFLKYWDGIFRAKISNNYVLSLVHSIRHFRNRWAHQSPFNERDVYRLSDESQALLEELKFDAKIDKNLFELNNIRLCALENLVYAEMNKKNNLLENKELAINNYNGIVNEQNYCYDAKHQNEQSQELNNQLEYQCYIQNQQFLDSNYYNYQTSDNQISNNFESASEILNNQGYFANQPNQNFNKKSNSFINQGNHNYPDEQNLNNYDSNTINSKNQNFEKNKSKSNINSSNIYNFDIKKPEEFFQVDKQMQEYDSILMKNQIYNKIIKKNLQNSNNQFNVYLHDDE